MVEFIKLKGKCCAIFKCDLKRAHRQIPVCPGEYNLLGYEWKSFMYVDRVLLMGLGSAALISMILVVQKFVKKPKKSLKNLEHVSGLNDCLPQGC